MTPGLLTVAAFGGLWVVGLLVMWALLYAHGDRDRNA